MALKVNRLIWLLGIFICTNISFAQISLDQEEWEKQRDDYEYAEPIEKELEDSSSNFDGFNINSPSEILRFFIFGIVLVILIFLIYKFIIANSKGADADEELVVVQDIKQAEDNLMKADLETLFDKLIKEKDYRSAIRVQYLQIIQLLGRKKIIKWEKQKTNFDYLMELNDDLVSDFSDTTFIFEEVWYGRENISASNVARMKKSCNHLKKLVN